MKFSFQFYISAQNFNWSEHVMAYFIENPFGLVL